MALGSHDSFQGPRDSVLFIVTSVSRCQVSINSTHTDYTHRFSSSREVIGWERQVESNDEDDDDDVDM